MRVFRKIVIMTIILSVCLMAFAGCSKSEVKTPGGNQSTDQPTDHSEGNPTDGGIIKEGTIEKDGNVILKQLAFVYQGNTIALSDIADDQKIESMLGKADEVKTHTYSPDDGLNMDQLDGRTEKQYRYPGLVIKTLDIAENNEPLIFQIEITDSNYPTVRNIKVGDTFEKLQEAYPEGNLTGGELTDEEDDFRYEPVNYVDVMTFQIKNKKVESIRIYTMID
ncbi:hypothetical protein FRZ06_00425 [Anoxybacterium hadale]|uniref:Uncharacterized protein n=1 Tax=Anoxybacterium hadale TaxID=3408580 RepID=A0ACD1A6C0_9FIRM|nr:hypothetical protein FRZ06_00425 [Clostridiales bacterium]